MSDLDAIARVREGLIGITDESTMDGWVEPSDVRALLRIIEATATDNATLTEERDRMNATLDEVNERLAKLEPQIDTITSNNARLIEERDNAVNLANLRGTDLVALKMDDIGDGLLKARYALRKIAKHAPHPDDDGDPCALHCVQEVIPWALEGLADA